MAGKSTSGITAFISKSQIQDANANPVGYAGGSFVTQDATGTPQTSPITVSSSEINLVVPDNATQFIFSNNANAVRIYETSGSSHYYVVPASTNGFTIDCVGMTNIYMIRDSTDVVVQFMFNLVR